MEWSTVWASETEMGIPSAGCWEAMTGQADGESEAVDAGVRYE